MGHPRSPGSDPHCASLVPDLPANGHALNSANKTVDPCIYRSKFSIGIFLEPRQERAEHPGTRTRSDSRVMFVGFVVRGNSYHIFSFRKANAREARRYHSAQAGQ
jgi:hypothetical protein